MRSILLLLSVGLSIQSMAQVTGANQVMTFLQLSQSPRVAAIGGLTAANPSRDVMLSFSNPALLRPEFHGQIGMSYNFFYAGTRISNVMFAQHSKSLNTTLGAGLQYINYGSFKQTDEFGNENGNVIAREYMLSLNASRRYSEKWRYGASLKYARSVLSSRKAAALLADIGLMFADTNHQWYVGAVIKNAGLMVQNYEKGNSSSLPMDLQIGIVKKFKKAPFSINVLGHHLYTWDIRYNNPADVVTNELLFNDTITKTKEKTYFADKLFRHLVFAIDIQLGKRFEASVGYNHLRRGELAYSEKKGLAGFSMGVGIYLNKFIVHYAQSHYHIAGAYHELGLNIKLNQLVGFGKGNDKINWAEKFNQEYK